MEEKFTDKLRAMAVSLGTGEKEEITIPLNAIAHELRDIASKDSPAAYIRNTMNRVTEIKEKGAVSIKKKVVDDVESDYYQMEYFSITLNQGKRKKVFNQAEVEAVRADEREKLINKILALSPAITNYAPEEYATLAKVVADYQDMIKKLK